jgi:putative colanic acid biosynthesis acetyltransferase WcaF
VGDIENASRNLQAFSPTNEVQLLKRIKWFIFFRGLFESGLVPSPLKVLILKINGSTIGKGVLIRRGVRVHFPWNLEIGDNCWIGEDAWFINHEKIRIGSNVCVSQRSIICSSGHDYRSASLQYDHKPIEIKDGAWICLDAKVLPGVLIGELSVVSAGEIVSKTLPDFSILIGGQIRPTDQLK